MDLTLKAGVLMRRRNRDTETHAYGRQSCEDRDRNCSDVAESQGMPRIPRNRSKEEEPSERT